MSRDTVHLGTTRQGYEVRVETQLDAIGFPMVERATATHPHTGVIRPIGEDHFPTIRNILMSQQIAQGAKQQADDALLPLTGLSEVALEKAMRYGSGGVQAHMKVHQALSSMAESLERECQTNLDTLYHRIDKSLGGQEAARESRHGLAVQDVAGDPQHGLAARAQQPSGAEQGRG